MTHSQNRAVVNESKFRDALELIDCIISVKGLTKLADQETNRHIDAVLAQNEEKTRQYQAGNTKVANYLIGQVMKATHNRADPQQVKSAIERKLKNDK